jgi:histidine triad (HIT) family protein
MLEVPIHAGCPFCDYLDGVERCAFVSQNHRTSSFVNRAQFERGALLVVPNEHRETILELEPDLLGAIYREAQRLAGAMVKAFGAIGVNVFQNNGVRAGQSVAHFHVHVVPRYVSSKPWRFHEVDVEHTPIDELEKIAVELRAALSRTESI